MLGHFDNYVKGEGVQNGMGGGGGGAGEVVCVLLPPVPPLIYVAAF